MSVVQFPERASCIRHGSARHPDERLVTVAEQLAAQVNEKMFDGAPPENVKSLSVLCHVLLEIAGDVRLLREAGR